MSARNDGGPAFPDINNTGMSLRDYFAAKALAGILTQPDARQCPHERDVESWRSEIRKSDAEWCYAMADAMLAARERSAV